LIDPGFLLPEPPTLKSTRLLLRPLRAGDAESLFDVFSDPVAMRWWSSPPHGSPLVTEEMLARAYTSFLAGDGVEWAIVLDGPGDDRAVGKIGHWRWQRAHSRSEVGFILHRDLWRRGLAAEALATAVEWGFRRLELHSVEAQLDIDNVASQRTLERVGFRREGQLRQSYFDGRQFRDTLVYGLLGSDFVKP
jgi:ribosomal-protein-alanine N-acetyltransferase